jgi:hypothetical protein
LDEIASLFVAFWHLDDLVSRCGLVVLVPVIQQKQVTGRELYGIGTFLALGEDIFVE